MSFVCSFVSSHAMPTHTPVSSGSLNMSPHPHSSRVMIMFVVPLSGNEAFAILLMGTTAWEPLLQSCRVTELLNHSIWKETKETQPPAQGKVTLQIRLTTCILKTSKDEDCTPTQENLFRCLSGLPVTKFFLLSSLPCSCLLPLVLLQYITRAWLSWSCMIYANLSQLIYSPSSAQKCAPRWLTPWFAQGPKWICFPRPSFWPRILSHPHLGGKSGHIIYWVPLKNKNSFQYQQKQDNDTVFIGQIKN